MASGHWRVLRSNLNSALVEANFAHSLQPPMVVDLVTTWASLARGYLDDVDPSEMAAECRPSSPNFELYYATDVDAYGDDGETMVADGVVKRLLIGPFSDCHEVDMFLY